MFQPIKDQGGHLGWRIGTKNTNLEEDVEFLLSVKFRQNMFSGFGGEVKNVKVYAGRTDDGQRAMTIAHLSLRLRWAKKSDHASAGPGLTECILLENVVISEYTHYGSGWYVTF